jgi:hypothetical protein
MTKIDYGKQNQEIGKKRVKLKKKNKKKGKLSVGYVRKKGKQ